jgi:hypothetical protein
MTKGTASADDIGQTRLQRSSVAALSGLKGSKGLFAQLGRLEKPGDGTGIQKPFESINEIEAYREEWLLNTKSLPPVMQAVEVENSLRIGPFSSKGYKDWADSLYSYFTQKESYGENMRHVVVSRCLDYMQNKKYRFRILPISVKAAYQVMRKGTNSGLPYFTSKWNSGASDDMQRRASQMLNKGKTKLYPFVLFNRVQQGKLEPWVVDGDNVESYRAVNKVRPVWGADHAETLTALCFLKPFLDGNAGMEGIMAYAGIEPLTESLTRRKVLPKGTVWVSGDVSAMDASWSEWWFNVAFDILETFIPEFGTVRRSILEYYLRGEIATPEGILKGEHGLPSGVGLTSLLNTFRMLAHVVYCMTEFGYDYDSINCECHGDDFIVAVKEAQAEALVHKFSELGTQVSPDKTHIGPDIHFLQRVWSDTLDCSYSIMRAISRLAYRERFITVVQAEENGKTEEAKYDKAIRMMQIYSVLENCKYNPIFESFVLSMKAKDQFNLDPQIIGDKWRFIADVKGYTSRPTEAESSGLTSLATYQVLMKSGLP